MNQRGPDEYARDSRFGASSPVVSAVMFNDETHRQLGDERPVAGNFRTLTSGLLVCVLILLAGCAGQPHPTLHELEKLPATEITYPGSVVSGQGGSDSNRKFGVNAAIYEKFALTNDQPAQILAYYQQQLTTQTWIRDDGVADGGESWSQMWGWAMGKRTFRLAIMSADYQHRFTQTNVQYAGYHTMYEVLIQ